MLDVESIKLNKTWVKSLKIWLKICNFIYIWSRE